MDNFEELLRKIEKNYENKDKVEKTTYEISGKTFEVLLLTRSEKADLVFGQSTKISCINDIYQWFKPVIYKTFQLKELALKAKEAGYIKEYYGIIDILFEPEEIINIIDFIIRSNNLRQLANEMVEFQKK